MYDADGNANFVETVKSASRNMNYNQIYERAGYSGGTPPLPLRCGIDPRAPHAAPQTNSQRGQALHRVHESRTPHDQSQQTAR